MSGDNVVAEIANDTVTVTDEKRCPFYLMNHSAIRSWLERRSLDISRSHARALLNIKGLSYADEAVIALSVHGATVTDNYWIKPDGEDISYNGVTFKDNDSFAVAFLGDITGQEKNTRPSPQLTVGGSLEKAWGMTPQTPGLWELYKRENSQEVFNELFCSYLSEYLGIRSAVYEMTACGVKTYNFAVIENLEDASCLFDDDCLDYLVVYNGIKAHFGDSIAMQYVHLLFFDAVAKNTDRHPGNFGVLRDRSSGKLLSLAPNYDYNQTLFGNTALNHTSVRKDYLITEFADLIKTAKIPFDIPAFDPQAFSEYVPDHLKSKANDAASFSDALHLVSERYRLLTRELR